MNASSDRLSDKASVLAEQLSANAGKTASAYQVRHSCECQLGSCFSRELFLFQVSRDRRSLRLFLVVFPLCREFKRNE